MTLSVVISDYTFPDLVQEKAAAEAKGASFAAHQSKSDAELAKLVNGADVVAVQFATFGPLCCAAVTPGATVIRYGVGYDNIDLKAAKQAGLKIGYVPDYCTDEVAEHCCAAAMALLRKLVKLDASVRSGDWLAVKHAKPIKPFAQTTFGFFGMGQIGQAILTRLKGFGFSFIVADPGLSEKQVTEMGATLVDEATLLTSADIISLNAPATARTTNFFNAARLAQMQPHAMIVNSARGQLIVENDIALALEKGLIGGAALDVFHAEPLSMSSRLREAPNLLLTPHAAWYSEAAINRLQGLVAQDITRALIGDTPRKPVRI